MNWVEFRNKYEFKKVTVKNKNEIDFNYIFGKDKYQIFVTLFSINKNKYTINHEYAEKIYIDEQRKIADFLKQKPKEWFKGVHLEDRYNLLLGCDEYHNSTFALYGKNMNWGCGILDTCESDGEALDVVFQFTNDEIERLKKNMPNERLRKIIDLSKVKTTETSFDDGDEIK